MIKTFPKTHQHTLQTALAKRGLLEASQVRFFLELLQVSMEELMLALLPWAAQYAIVPVSNYKVGAVALGGDTLYLGSNFEFAQQALNASVHAEQSAVANAWIHGESSLELLAVSAPPCGHCRQFLYELHEAERLTILLPSKGQGPPQSATLSAYLPNAFGPQDLEVAGGLMAPAEQSCTLHLKEKSHDPLVLQALEAAQKSYAPYTQNYAGCAIKTKDQTTTSGRYAENAAHNPSLSPLQASLAFFRMNHPCDQPLELERAVLVEAPTQCSQQRAIQATLEALAPEVTLESYEASLGSNLQ